jgi:hypothetical protein
VLRSRFSSSRYASSSSSRSSGTFTSRHQAVRSWSGVCDLTALSIGNAPLSVASVSSRLILAETGELGRFFVAYMARIGHGAATVLSIENNASTE